MLLQSLPCLQFIIFAYKLIKITSLYLQKQSRKQIVNSLCNKNVLLIQYSLITKMSYSDSDLR